MEAPRDKEAARHIVDAMLQTGRILDVSLARMRETASEEEFVAYRDVVSKLLTKMLLEVMNPVFRAHPELTPPGLSAGPAMDYDMDADE